jgi:hypothetical protein
MTLIFTALFDPGPAALASIMFRRTAGAARAAAALAAASNGRTRGSAYAKKRRHIATGIAERLRLLHPAGRPEWPGHAAFILTGLSFASPSELSLRLLATSSCALSCLFNYYHPVGKVLWLPLRWNALYLALNSFYAARLLSEKLVTLSPEEQHVYSGNFAASMTPADFKRFFALGKEMRVDQPTEAEVITKGRHNDALVLLLEGSGLIYFDESVHIERKAGLFGEVSFLHGGEPSATVRFKPGSRYIQWSRKETGASLTGNAKRGLEHAISLEVTRHLASTSSRLVQTQTERQISRLARRQSLAGAVAEVKDKVSPKQTQSEPPPAAAATRQ